MQVQLAAEPSPWLQVPLAGLVLLGAAGTYLLPALVALRRGHPDRHTIAVVNALLGWTVVVWVGALVWALSTPEDME